MANNVKYPGFKNIQIQGKIELADLFEDTFRQSGANSKGEFLGNLLEDYLNPDLSMSKKASEKEAENKELSEKLSLLVESNDDKDSEIQELHGRLTHYENDILQSLFIKHKGKRLKFRAISGKMISIEVNNIKDVYTAVINSIKV